jgi:hypothetical protein
LRCHRRGYARAAPPVCVGDIHGAGTTDVFDFAIFAPDFGCPNP